MKKLTLDELEVTTFVTLPEPQERGTVQGQARPIEPEPDPSFQETWCGVCQDTNPDFCCTYGCSQNTACDDGCILVEP